MKNTLNIGRIMFSAQKEADEVTGQERKVYLINTRFGPIKGLVEDGVIAFRGVPFAQPPIGELRFKAPRPLQKWNGLYDATFNRAASYQFADSTRGDVLKELQSIDPGVPGIMAWPGYVDKTYNQPEVSEDCLYLNIWIPETDFDHTIPVYIYYHGGANAVSAGSFELERGDHLAKEEQAIIVRPNYRMGALGWVHFALLSDEFSEAKNLGVQDQIAALKWVAENIASFGGNPDEITIGGESAGATAVSHLLTNPDARQYARRAVIQSLTPFNPWSTQHATEARFVADLYLKLLKIEDIKELKTIHPNKLLAVQSVLTRLFEADKHIAWRPLGAVIDGDTVPFHPTEYLATQKIKFRTGFELMLGFAKDEWQFFRGHSETIRHGDKTAVLNVLRQVFGDRSERLFEAYRTLYPNHISAGHILSDIMSFEFFKYGELAIAKNMASQGIPTFVYQFSYDLPGWTGDLRAVHTGNIPFLFRNFTAEDLALWPSFDGIDRKNMAYIAQKMGVLYGRFFRRGLVGSTWKAYDAASESVLWFGKEIENKDHLLTDEWKAFENAGIQQVGDLEKALVANVRKEIDEYKNR